MDYKQAWEIVREALVEADVPAGDVEKLLLSEEQVNWLNRALEVANELLSLVVELIARVRRLEAEVESLRRQAEQQCHGCLECGLD